MKRTIILIFTAVLALLTAACGASEAGPTASPAPSGPNVQVHWDALETPQASTVERWYEEYAPELIPSDEYGQLVPYIGGESQSEIWGTSWFYGLATHDGVIVTDPVFLEVTALDWYDPAKYGRVQGGALILHSAVEAADGPVDEYSPGFEDRYGLAAVDGSWYTGQVYTDLICQSELGALFFDLDGCIVMVSAGGGAELWRWEAGEIPFEGLVPDMYYWDSVSTSGDYMIYTEWDGATGDSWLTYVDLRDGSVLDGEPEVPDHGSAYDPESDRTRFSGGWYSISGGVLSIELDSGETHSFPMPEGSGEYSYPDIDGDRAIISLDGGASVMTDLDGNELLRTDGYMYWIWQQYGDAPRLATVAEFIADESGTSGHSIFTVYDRDGRELLVADGTANQFGDRLQIADAGSYRLTDLEGNDLIRLSRWQAMDIPAED